MTQSILTSPVVHTDLNKLLQSLFTTCPSSHSLTSVRVLAGVIVNDPAWLATVVIPLLKTQIDLLAAALGHANFVAYFFGL